MRGRKPKTFEQRALEGNPGGRALTLAPKTTISADTYPAPAWLSRRGRDEWTRLEPELRAIGSLTVGDLAAYAGYCSAVAVAREVEEHLGRAKGSPKTKAFWVGSARKAWGEVRKWAVELGLTPVARVRLRPTGDGKKQDDLGAFLERKRRA
jgi:P27 family predicted phage terminase small subunit